MDRVSQAQALVAVLAEQLCSSVGVVHQQSYSNVPSVSGTSALFAHSITDTLRAINTVVSYLPSMTAEALDETDNAISESQRVGDDSTQQLRFVADSPVLSLLVSLPVQFFGCCCCFLQLSQLCTVPKPP